MIGIFDSGLGGLAIWQGIIKRLPQYDYFYLADTANLPYGEKRQSEIYHLTQKAVSFLFQQGCQLVILACNTASAKALRKIQREWLPNYFPERRVLGVIRPTVETINEIIDQRQRAKFKVGLLATQATVDSGAYICELKKINQSIEIIQQPAPKLVPLIEKWWRNKNKNYLSEISSVLQKYLTPLISSKIDVLVLGCTHYSLIYPQIYSLLPKEIKIISQDKIVANKLVDYLQRHPEIDKKLTKNHQRKSLKTKV